MVDIIPDHQIKLDEQAAQKRNKTAGEKAFDRITYTGIGFGVNEVSSLWITDQFVHGKPIMGAKWFSREGFEAASEWIAKTFKLTDKLNHKGQSVTAKARAGNALLMATLLSGGTLLIWPIKKLEDHRGYWSKKLNHLFDRLKGNTMPPEAIDARDKEVDQAIACMPRQSWPSLLAGRAAAMFASWGTGTFLIGQHRNERIMDGAEHGVSGLIEGANIISGGSKESTLGRLATHAQERRFNDKGEREFNTLQRYSRLIGVETYSCAISSIVLEIASKFLSRNKAPLPNPELCPPVEFMPPAEPQDRPSHVLKLAPKQALYTQKIAAEAKAGQENLYTLAG